MTEEGRKPGANASPVRIDQRNGTLELPNGHVVRPSLSKDEFLRSEMSQQARAQEYGTPPWIHFRFAGGTVGGRELLVSLCFYDQVLVCVIVAADLYPPGPKDWSRYSLEIEADIKRFHDSILRNVRRSNESRPATNRRFFAEQRGLGPHARVEFPLGASDIRPRPEGRRHRYND